MKISVVIPVHNEERYRPIYCVLCWKRRSSNLFRVGQFYRSLRRAILEKFSTIRPKSKIIKKLMQDCQVSRSLRFGGQHAKGDFIYLGDADIVIYPEVVDERNWEKGDALRFRYYHYNVFRSLF